MISEKRLRKLSDPDYREEYLKSTVTAWLVHQLRALRHERDWTQAELAAKAGNLPQSAIGRYESESYGNWNTNTLLKLAKAFDVALEIRFVSWRHFIKSTSDTSSKAMSVTGFSQADFAVVSTVYQRFVTGPTEQQITTRTTALRYATHQNGGSAIHRNGLN